MKNKITCIVAFLYAVLLCAQTDCGEVVNYDFEGTTTSLPDGWTEYNTSGRVTVDSGRLKMDFTTDKPSVYYEFPSVSKGFLYSFDIVSTRNYVDCNMSLISSDGKFLTSITFANYSNLNIQYATSISENLPSGYTGALIQESFKTNTTYTIDAQVDFDSQTVDFYNKGKLMAADVPFLENVQNVAKVDVKLNYMYSNEGRFFFDNISILSSDENRLVLTSNLSVAEELLNTLEIGQRYNQYPQTAVDAFQTKVTNVRAVLDNCLSTSSAIDKAILELETAQQILETNRVNDPVLKLYNQVNFSGTEHAVYCGYYNGGLGTYEDWAKSFTLEQGYMVTFAEDVNGLGTSKVYIAADNELKVNLPEALQESISFIRVSPWFGAQKKGGVGKGLDVIDSLKVSWYYDWGSSGDSNSDREYVPMTWSGTPSLTKVTELGSNMEFNHYLACNEPDGADQANMTVDQAITAYKNMLASGLRLGAPAVTDGARGREWLAGFMAKCEELNYRVDFIPIHHYVRRSTAGFKTWIEEKVYDIYQLPIWVTEYNYGNANFSTVITDEVALERLQGYNDMLESQSYIERYSPFYFQPNQGQLTFFSVRNPLTLNDIGIYYRDYQPGGIGYVQENYDQGGLSVTNNLLASEIEIYPKLITKGFFDVTVSDKLKGSSLELFVYDITGKLILETSYIDSSVDVSGVSGGIYFVKLKTILGTYSTKIFIR